MRIHSDNKKVRKVVIVSSIALGAMILIGVIASASMSHMQLFTSSNATPGLRPSLFDPTKKEIAMKLVSSAEYSTIDWKSQYAFIKDIGDNRGYTAGIIGFTSGTGDMLELIQYYVQIKPSNNILAKYIPALEKVVGTASHDGLDPTFVADWKTAANDPLFRQAQDYKCDTDYFNPSVTQAEQDGLGALGQFIYYDAMVMHGPGNDTTSFGGIRAAAMEKAKTPAQGGNESQYLNAFLDTRKAVMLADPIRVKNTSRIDTEQRVFLQQSNLDLNPPLIWRASGGNFTIPQ